MVKSILIIEDSEIDLMVLQRALVDNNAELELIHYETANAALNYLLDIVELMNTKSHLPNLITLDFNLPGMNGLEFLKIIKLHPNLRSIPVIILSTSDNPLDIQAAYDNGAACYLKKKLSYDQFKRDVNNMLNFWFETVLLNESTITS